MLFKRRNQVITRQVILCNRYLQTSNQLERALNNNKNLHFTNIVKCQFPWVALNEISKNKFEFLFIDKNTDSNKDLKDILVKINHSINKPKIIMLVNTIDQEVTDFITSGLIDSYLLMPFQDSHVNMCIEKITTGNEIEL